MPKPDKDSNASGSTGSPIKVGEREFASVDDLVAAHTNLETKLGEMGKESGDLKTQLAQAQGKIDLLKEGDKGKAKGGEGELTTDFEAQIADVEAKKAAIQEKINAGDMALEEGMTQIDSLNDQKIGLAVKQVESTTIEQANKALKDALAKRDANANEKEFLKENPRFLELKESGALDAKMKEEGPIVHDELSAYYAVLADEEAAKAKELEEKLTLKEGAGVTDDVLTGDGSGVRSINRAKAPPSTQELRKSGLQALRGAT